MLPSPTMANMWPQMDLPNPENLYEHATRLERDFGSVVLDLERSGAELLSKNLLLKLHSSYAQLAKKLMHQSKEHALTGKSEGPGAQNISHAGSETKAVFQMKVHDEDNGTKRKRGCDEGRFSEAHTGGEENTDNEDGEAQDGEFMMRGAMPVGEAMRARSPAYQRSSGSGQLFDCSPINRDHVNAFSAPRDIFHDVYIVEMRSVEYASMDLSDEKTMHQVARTLIRTNFQTPFGCYVPSDILDIRWKTQDSRPISHVNIYFATREQAIKALSGGLLWNGKYHACFPLHENRVTRCNDCLEYGHRKPCNNPIRCMRCGSKENHTHCDKSRIMKCPACGGPHSFINPRCPQLLVEMRKQGLWPSKIKVDNGPSPPFTAEDKHKVQDIDEARSQRFSTDTIRIPTLSGSTPDPSDTKAILERLDGLKSLVLARNPVPQVAGTSRPSKRKLKSRAHGRRHFSAPAPAPKRAKLEKEVYIKQEE